MARPPGPPNTGAVRESSNSGRIVLQRRHRVAADEELGALARLVGLAAADREPARAVRVGAPRPST